MPFPQLIFELCNQTLAGATPDVLGLWVTAPLTAEETVAFATPAETVAEIPPEASVWRANFPTDVHLAMTHLQGAEARLAASRQRMTEAPNRLEMFVKHQNASPSFDSTSQEIALAEPERELSASLQAIQAGPTPVSFGWGEGLLGGGAQWQGAAERFRTYVAHVLTSVLHYAWVETCCEERCLGRTGVGWTGDTTTVWRQGLTAGQIQLHQRHLALALASRDEFVRIFIIAMQCAVRLVMLLNMPGTMLQILPAVWKFINQILADK